VDREVAALQRVIASFHRCRNSFSPFSRLPVEVIAQIFTIHAENQPPASDEWNWPEGESGVPSLSHLQLGWIVVTHVCRHWRDVAIAHTSLWTTIPFGLGERWVQEMFNRAKSAPV
ncbi:hypothetical protein K488DRAFT_39058, partial [Vararia minispora EC-137]